MGNTKRRDMVRGTRLVDDPSTTDSQYYAEQEGQNPNAGKVGVMENPILRIGALTFIRHRTAMHERAAEMFKGLYESLYGAGQEAMDPSRVQVDTSPMAHDSGLAGRIDRGDKLRKVKDALSKQDFNRVVGCVVLGIPCGEMVDHWRQRKKETQALLDALDQAADVWGLSGVSGGRRDIQVADDGSDMVFTGEVSTRKRVG